MVVLLPQPEEPTKATNWPGEIWGVSWRGLGRGRAAYS